MWKPLEAVLRSMEKPSPKEAVADGIHDVIHMVDDWKVSLFNCLSCTASLGKCCDIVSQFCFNLLKYHCVTQKPTPSIVQNFFQNWSVRNWPGMGHLLLRDMRSIQLSWFGIIFLQGNSLKDRFAFPNQPILNQFEMLSKPHKIFQIWLHFQ